MHLDSLEILGVEEGRVGPVSHAELHLDEVGPIRQGTTPPGIEALSPPSAARPAFLPGPTDGEIDVRMVDPRTASFPLFGLGLHGLSYGGSRLHGESER
jgi:hypothetical protein